MYKMKDFSTWLQKRNNQISKSGLYKSGFNLLYLFEEIEKKYGKEARKNYVNFLFDKSIYNISGIKKTETSCQEKEKILTNYENNSLHTIAYDSHLSKVEQIINKYQIDYLTIQNCLINFAIADLVKMAMSSKDIKTIHDAHNKEGDETASADFYLESHIPDKKYSDFLKSPKAVESKPDLNQMGIATKTVHELPEDTFMTKPFHASVDATPYAKDLISGWATMATKNLFHAGGIGHLCENVNASLLTDPKTGSSVPVTVHRFQPDYTDTFSAIDDRRDLNTVPVLQHKQIALMDFLTNNLDRHGLNIMQADEPDKNGNTNLLAIDHERNFQYHDNFDTKFLSTDKKTQAEREGPVSLLHYLKNSTGIAHYYYNWRDRTQAGTEKKGLEDLKDWWKIYKGSIKQSFLNDIQHIKNEDVRQHVMENFFDRYNAVNNWQENSASDYPQTKGLIPRKVSQTQIDNYIKDKSPVDAIKLVTGFYYKMHQKNKNVPNKMQFDISNHFKTILAKANIKDFAQIAEHVYNSFDHSPSSKNEMMTGFANDLRKNIINSIEHKVFSPDQKTSREGLDYLDTIESMLEKMVQSENYSVFGKKNIMTDLIRLRDIKSNSPSAKLA